MTDPQTDVSLPDVPSDLPSDPLASYSPDITEIFGNSSPGPSTPERGDPSVPAWTSGSSAPERQDYKLLRLSGEGGFGQVWQAVQTSLDRVVALKVIKEEFRDGRNAPFVVASFQQEALTTARLEHPNIVPIYDLGADAAGRPVLAMKFVRGRGWTELLNRDLQTLHFDDFLATHLPVLVSVAQAVAYAHSRGVVHRDIKTSQVMVGEYGETLLMDWGLAIAVGVRSDEGAEDTLRSSSSRLTQETSNPAGTVAYMAPEQTLRDVSRIGPWTDVYLLGGVLYTLLTGGPVHPAADGSKAFAQARKGFFVDPLEAAPGRALPEELVQLVRDSLQPDIADRLPTAALFVDRLQRYLSGAGKRTDSEKITEAATARLRQSGRTYRDYTDVLNDCARAAEFWAGNPRVPGLREDALEGFAEAALGNRDLVLAGLQAEQLSSPRGNAIRMRIASAELAQFRQRRHRKVSSALIAALGVLLLATGVLYTTTIRRERARQTEARERAEDLMRFMLTDLRASLEPIGRIALLDQITGKAGAYFRSIPPDEMSDESRAQRANLLDTVGEIYFVRGDIRKATAAYSEAAAIRKDLVARNGDNLQWTADLARSHYNRAKMLESEGEAKRALEEYARSGRILATVVARDPGTIEFKRRLASKQSSTGELLLAQGNAREALAELRASNAIYAALSAMKPADGDLRRELAVTFSKVGDAHDALGEADASLDNYTRYERIMAELVAREPRNLQWKRELAVAHNSLGWAYRAKGDSARALSQFNEQRRGMREIVEAEPGNVRWQRELAFSEAVIGRTLQGLGRHAEAVDHLRRSSETLGEFAARDRNNSAWQRDAAVSRTLFGEALLTLGKRDAALAEIGSALAVMQELSGREPGNAGWKRDVAQSHRLCGGILLELRRRQEGEAHLRSAVALMEPLTRDAGSASVAFLDTHASALLLLGRIEEARPLVETLRARGYNDATFTRLADGVR